MHQLPRSSLLLLFALPLAAQDMIGVTFGGQVLRLDSSTGTATVLASGAIGKNGLACTVDNRLWTTIRTGTTGNFQHFLTEIDPFTGAETITPFQVGDVRGLASDGSRSGLFAIRENPGNDQLVRIDTATGTVTLVGNTGFSSLQALDDTALGLHAWDLAAGFVSISPTTGAGTDSFPGVGGPSGLQFLATNPETGETIVGRDQLHLVSLFSGTTSLVSTISGGSDLRGAEFTTSRTTVYGSACAGDGGGVRIGTVGAYGAGLPLVTRSNNHAANGLGVLIVGFSDTVHAGSPLPFPLDPLLGTSGCQLNASIDATFLGFGDPTGDLTIAITLPPALAFFQLYVQHAAFEQTVPGGMSWSHGLRVRPRL